MSLMISREHARAIAIGATGLDRRPEAVDKAAVLETLRKIAVLQIDTIHVVARSPYLVLWSRLGAYDPAWFDELQYPDGQLFEYWAHAASFVPIEHWPLLRPRMLLEREEISQNERAWLDKHGAVLEQVRATIKERGPLRSADFAAPEDHKSGGWWEWKPAKTALDILWTRGELVVERRINFQRVYELTERFLPNWDDSMAPSPEAARAGLAELGLRAMGIATAQQLPDYFRQRKAGMAELLERWHSEGRVIKVGVEGWQEPAYIHSDHAAWLDQPPQPTLTTLLSPFDNLIWDRERTLALWDFFYRIECYTPAPKRRYGYFSLPILHKDILVGRLDAKAERKHKVFRVFALHLEPGVAVSEELAEAVAGMLLECAAWHGTPEVVIERSDPAAFGPLVEARL